MNIQREAIERVIAELNQQVGFCEIVLESDPFDTVSISEKYAYEFAIDKLKEVLANADRNSRNPPKPERNDQRQQTK